MKHLVYILITIAVAALIASCSPKTGNIAIRKKAKTLHPFTPSTCRSISAAEKLKGPGHYFLIDFKIRTKNREVVGYVGYSCVSSHPSNLLLREIVSRLTIGCPDEVTIIDVTGMNQTDYNSFFKRGDLQPVVSINAPYSTLN